MELEFDQNRWLLDEHIIEPAVLKKIINQLAMDWADFHLYITSPTIAALDIPKIILPAKLENANEYEFVYSINDYGYKLSTSKGEDAFVLGQSMHKMYCTIEKMIFILTERIQEAGGNTETEVQVAFGGYELAQRKAFESIINLNYNVIVTNFDPGVWGDRYLQLLKTLADKGYGYPPVSPRMDFRTAKNIPGVRSQKRTP